MVHTRWCRRTPGILQRKLTTSRSGILHSPEATGRRDPGSGRSSWGQRAQEGRGQCLCRELGMEGTCLWSTMNFSFEIKLKSHRAAQAMICTLLLDTILKLKVCLKNKTKVKVHSGLQSPLWQIKSFWPNPMKQNCCNTGAPSGML